MSAETRKHGAVMGKKDATKIDTSHAFVHVREMKIYSFFCGAVITRDVRAHEIYDMRSDSGPMSIVHGAESAIQIAFTILSDRSLHASRLANVIIYIAARIRCESGCGECLPNVFRFTIISNSFFVSVHRNSRIN